MNTIRRLFLFLVVFSPPLKFLIFTPSKWSIIIMVIVLYDRLVTRKMFSRRTLIISGVWFIYSLARVVLSGEPSFLAQHTFFNLEYLLVAYLFVEVFYVTKSFVEVEKDIVWVGIVQASVILIMASNSSFYELVISLYRQDWVIYVRELNSRYFGLRGFGFSGSWTYDLSIVLGFANLVLLSLYRQKIIRFSIVLIGTLVFVLAGLFVARSYFIVMIVMTLFILDNPRKIIYSSALVLLIVGFIVLNRDIVLNLVLGSNRSSWIFEGLISMLSQGSYESASTTALRSMYDIDYNNVMGYGIYTNEEGGYYGHTDVGYLRHYLFGGVVGVVLMLLFWFNWARGALENRLLLSVFVLMIIINFKGDILFASGQAIRMSSILFLAWRKK